MQKCLLIIIFVFSCTVLGCGTRSADNDGLHAAQSKKKTDEQLAQERLDQAATDADKKDAALALEAILKKYNRYAWVPYPGREPQPSPDEKERRESVLIAVFEIWEKLNAERAKKAKDAERNSKARKDYNEFDMIRRRAEDRAAQEPAMKAYENKLNEVEVIMQRWASLLDDKTRLATEYSEHEMEIVVAVGYMAPHAIAAKTMEEWRSYLELFFIRDAGYSRMDVIKPPPFGPINAIVQEVLKLKKSTKEVDDLLQRVP